METKNRSALVPVSYKKITQIDLYKAWALVAEASIREIGAIPIWKRDLILIPKTVRMWMDVIMIVIATISLIILPLYYMETAWSMADLCIVSIGIGIVMDLMFALFIYRAIRKGVVEKDILIKPFRYLFNKFNIARAPAKSLIVRERYKRRYI